MSVFIGYFYYTENQNWAAQNLPLGGRWLDTADLIQVCVRQTLRHIFDSLDLLVEAELEKFTLLELKAMRAIRAEKMRN